MSSSNIESPEILAEKLIKAESSVRGLGQGKRIDFQGLRRGVVEPLLNQAGVHPTWKMIVLADSGLLYPAGFPPDQITGSMEIYYGIAMHQREFGICDPATLRDAQVTVLRGLLPRFLSRIPRVPGEGQITLGDIRRLGQDLNIPAAVLTNIPRR